MAILDNHTDCVGGYAVTKLRDSQINCMRIRRVSDDAFLDVGFNSYGLVDLDAIKSHTIDKLGVSVHTWYDQSGSGNNLVAPSKVEEPLLTAGDTYYSLNKVLSIYFDGVNSTLNTSSVLVSGTGARSVFIIGKAANPNTDGKNKILNFSSDSSNYFRVFANRKLEIQGGSIAATDGNKNFFQPTLFSFTVNAEETIEDINVYTNNVITDITTVSGTTAIDTGTLGVTKIGDKEFWGELQAVLVFNTSVNNTQVTNELISALSKERVLDLYPTNARGAYSLARLRKDQIFCARVKRSSDGTEEDIGFNLKGLINEDHLLKFCDEGDGDVVTFYDQSLAGFDMTDDGSPPNIVTGGVVNKEKGFPVISFVATPEYLETTEPLVTGSTPRNIFIRCSLKTENDNSYVFALNNYSGLTTNGIRYEIQLKLELSFSGSIEYYNDPIYELKDLSVIFPTGGVNASDHLVYIGNKLITRSGLVDVPINTEDFGGSIIGARGNKINGFVGNVQTVVVYDADKGADREKIEDYLSDYFNHYYYHRLVLGTVKLLRTVENNSPLQVRRESDQEVQNINFDSDGILDVAQLKSFIGGGTGYVYLWYNQVDQDLPYHYSNNNDDISPIIVLNGEVQYEQGVPTLLFDQSRITINKAPSLGNTARSITFVTKKINNSFTTLLRLTNITGDGNNFIIQSDTRVIGQNAIQEILWGNNSVLENRASLFFIGNPNDGAVQDTVCFQDGVQATPTQTIDGTQKWNIQEGNSNIGANYSGTITVIAVSEEDLSSVRADLEKYLADIVSVTYDLQSDNYLLDSETGAKFAYALRKLRKDQVNCITVRRTNDNATQLIGFNIFGGLNTVALLDFVGNKDGYIEVWYDQSGKGRDLILSDFSPLVVDREFMIVENGNLITSRGKPAAFSAYNSAMMHKGTTDILTGSSDAHSIFVVFETLAENSFKAPFFYIDEGNNPFFLSSELRLRYANNVAPVGKIKEIQVQTQASAIIPTNANGEDVEFYNNGELLTITGLNLNQAILTDAGKNLLVGVRNNGEDPYFGFIQELIFFAGDKSTTRQDIEKNQFDYYNINENLVEDSRDFFVHRLTYVMAVGEKKSPNFNLYGSFNLKNPFAKKYFIQITNNHHTGMGTTSGGDLYAPIHWSVWLDFSNIEAGEVKFKIKRNNGTFDCRVDLQVVEYIGETGGENEFIVLEYGNLTLADGVKTATITVTGHTDINNVVPWIAGQSTNSTDTAKVNSLQFVTSKSNNDITFERGDSEGVANVSYMLVEFIGSNWNVRREEFNTTGSTTTLTISPLTNYTKAFNHQQMYFDDQSANSGLAQCSARYRIISNSQVELFANSEDPRRAVMYIIENPELEVIRYNGVMEGIGEEEIDDLTISEIDLRELNQTAIMGQSNSSTGTSADFPRGFINYMLQDNNTVRLRQIDAEQTSNYVFELVFFPKSLFSKWHKGELQILKSFVEDRPVKRAYFQGSKIYEL